LRRNKTPLVPSFRPLHSLMDDPNLLPPSAPFIPKKVGELGPYYI
jgi:hypothetical protein